MNKEKTPYNDVVNDCISEFKEKNKKYGQSWIEDRIFTLAQQILIKLVRIKTIQEIGTQKINDPVEKELPGIFNYCILAKVRIKWTADNFLCDHTVSHEKVLAQYLACIEQIKDLYTRKNHDYGEIWRNLLISTMVDFMLTKYRRLETIYLDNTREESEKLDDYDEIFKDIANYALFSIVNIKDGMSPLK